HRQYRFPESVRLMDGGTQGLYLVQFVQAAKKLLVFDAVDYGLKPGTVKLVYNDEVPKFMGAKKMSLHQTGFQEVLAAAELTGRYPEELLLIGIQPANLEDYGGSLTDIVKTQMARCLYVALQQLKRWGVEPAARFQPLPADERINLPGLELEAYEAGRPSEADACRTGDARVLFGGN
ncbi:MAG: HyaD/HybD family hydrogenase maturation endopeptidase, partial [Sulfuricella sp.]|nr:HyaD/HybD family hydrogenase maturation endopeptidase [Sulfuricella sp.]